MSQILSLESFEVALGNDDVASADYNQGYQDGLAAGAAAAQAEAAVLDEAFVHALSDIDFTYAEARRQILQSLGPLFATLVDHVLPHCIETGFASQISDVLQKAATADATAPITLHVHPDTYDAVAARLADMNVQLNLKTDPSLSPHATWVQHGDGETLLDADKLLVEISDLFGIVLNEDDRIKPHG